MITILRIIFHRIPLFLLICMLGWGVGGFLATLGWSTFHYRNRASEWEKTDGRIIQAELEVSKSKHNIYYKPLIAYEYHVNGRQYTGRQIRGSGVSGKNKKNAYQYLNRYQLNTDVTVFYRPENSKRSVLETDVDSSEIFFAILCIFLSLILLICPFVFLYQFIRKKGWRPGFMEMPLPRLYFFLFLGSLMVLAGIAFMTESRGTKDCLRDLESEDKTQRIGAFQKIMDAKLNKSQFVSQLLPALRRALQDEDAEIRGYAVWVMGNAEIADRGKILYDLFPLLGDPDVSVRRETEDAIIKQHKQHIPQVKTAVPVLSEIMRREYESWVRQDTESESGRYRPFEKSKVLGVLTTCLAQEKADVRSFSAYAVSAFPSIGADMLPVLSGGLGDSERYVRLYCAVALGKMGTEAEPALPALINCVNDPDDSVRKSCISTLGKIGKKAAGAVFYLKKSLSDKDTLVRRATAESLGNMGPGAREAVPQLVYALHDKDREVRKKAARALGNMGSDAKMAVSVLKNSLEDRDESVRWEISQALQKIQKSLHSVPPPSESEITTY